MSHALQCVAHGMHGFMHTENVVFMDAPADAVYALACDIDAWPRLLPHYRSVTVREQTPDGTRKQATMNAVRPGWPVRGVRFPVRWDCVQVCDPAAQTVTFKHTRGVAQGMWVVWTLAPDPYGRGTRVSIAHDLRYPLPFLNGWWAREMVGRQFVGAIAGRTLSTFKSMVESKA